MINFSSQSSSLVTVLRKRAASSPQKMACQFLEDGSSVSATLTYGELDQRARAIAAFLQNKKLAGERILLLYPAGLDFICAYLGCLYAGAIAVPVQTPKVSDLKKASANIVAIAKDADIVGIFTNNDYVLDADYCFSDLFEPNEIFVFDTTGVVLKNASKYRKPQITQDTICYLQYTSGSTGTAKGAVVQHKHLTHSLKITLDAWQYDKNSVTLTWAPHSHVYGLICGLLMPIYHGTPVLIMPTDVFIQKPLVWLTAISDYKVTHSGCPNFGYDLCVKDIADSEVVDLDLFSWKVAINGGDRVQAGTLEAFANKFSPCGFQIENFNSAYGMSEVTGAISVGQLGKAPKQFNLSNEALQHNEVLLDHVNVSRREVISNGRLLPGIEAKIVDPEKCEILDENHIGEIWLTGKSVVGSYWHRAEESEKIFQAKLVDSEENYFRTGDLGFLHQGELCLTGRLKDVIVIYGKKHYPLDVEKSAADVLLNYDLIGNRICFSVLIGDKEEVILLQEIDNTLAVEQQDEIVKLILHAVAKYHRIDLYSVQLVNKGAISRTASGKVQRNRCKLDYQQDKIAIIKNYVKTTHQVVQQPVTISAPVIVENKNLTEIFQADFRAMIAKILSLDPDGIDLDSAVSNYQIDSISTIRIAGAFNEKYGFNITPADLYAYHTLLDFLADLLSNHKNVLNIYYSGALSQTTPPVEYTQDIEPEPIFSLTSPIENVNHTDMAVIGMSGIFPGAANVEEFWQNLINGNDVISEIPGERWSWQNYYGDPAAENKSDSKWGGFIGGISHFDANFFNISTREAELTDPQHRLFLQSVWRAIEDAGYSIGKLNSQKTGLFVGVFNHDYAELLQTHGSVDAYSTTGVSSSILANRVSYLLNLHGPSEAIDTACSSSLVAVHHAVQAIKNGDCEIAVVGGVNALLTPTAYISASKAGMLSADGRCKTFDKSANGFVRSEGVAAILIKPLEKALQDKDHIYGVIKGTAVNHGGHANSLTAPSPNAQAEVIAAAWRRAKIDVASIQYIETHGTGTVLGDPVEVNGLKKAFEILAREQQKELPNYYCGLGALKTHVGHLESAAGIVGIVKVLLALNYEKLPGNLHFTELNPYVETTNSPFYLVNETQDWPRKDSKRSAGISSFGFGGTNAHVVIEEAPLSLSAQQSPVEPFVIALSAKTDAALEQRILDLSLWLSKQDKLPSLSEVSFTLNRGRDHFTKRCAFVVSTFDSLTNILSKTLKTPHTGRVISEANDTLAIQKLNTQAELYVNGNDTVLESLDYPNQQRISLPTYPFAKTAYWVPEKTATVLPSNLFYENISNGVFTKTFSGNEFYFADHKVKGKKVLPGTVYVEMALQAAKIAAVGKTIAKIQNVIWVNALTQREQSHNVTITLHPEPSALLFQIASGETLLAQGQMLFGQNNTINEQVNLAELKGGTALVKADFYRQFANAGIVYGNSLQVVAGGWRNNNEILTELQLPANVDTRFMLHPSLLDGALQSVFPLLKNPENLYLPFSVDEITIYAPLPAQCFVHAAVISDQASMPIYAIKIYDKLGGLLLQIKNFALKLISTTASNIHYYAEQWISQPATPNTKVNDTFLIVAEESDLVTYFRRELPAATIVSALVGKSNLTYDEINYRLDSADPECFAQLLVSLANKNLLPNKIIYLIGNSFESNLSLQKSFYNTFHLCKALLQHRLNQNTQILCVTESHSIYVEALAGFAKSIYLENPRLQLRTIKITEFKNILAELNSQEITVAYDQAQRRTVKTYQEVKPFQGEVLLKKSGIYLITGGTGSLGLVFARYLAQNYQAKLVLMNRFGLTEEKKAVIEALKEFGAEVIYLQADVSKIEELHKAMHAVKNRFGHLNGIIHAAGLTKDAYLLKKSASDCAAVLAAKVTGTINLDEASKSFQLDFFMLFSSAAAVLGNLGQTDYAYANHFMDLFAKQRDGLQRFGKSLSINWPLWLDGGIKISQASETWLTQTFGIVPLRTEEGISAFHAALAGANPQLVVLPGQKNILELSLAQSFKAKDQATPEKIYETPVESTELSASTMQYLKNILATATKIKPELIQAQDAFEVYGIDSVMIIGLNQQLAHEFENLPKTIFFEYKNLAELTQYFIENYSDVLASKLNLKKPERTVTLPRAIPHFTPAPINVEDIAIIGLSGRYPEADDLHAFWENLKTGRDSITTLPADRWTTRNNEKIWGGFISDVDKFDPQFFNIAPREAEAMDPQERLFLETAWQTIEDAGYASEQLATQKVGVFVGVMYGQYQLLGNEAFRENTSNSANSVFASIANRVSYFFDFHGPSIALDTMCSSSLTAIHLACQSIQNGESVLAIAGGVNVHIHPDKFRLLNAGNFLSTDGRCRSFGEGGDGYVPGEGVGAVLLKPLSKAIADHDHIYGVIKGSDVNHGGKTNGYTVPNPAAQSSVIAEAYNKAKISPETISYLETHGTGTALGDPIEIASLSKVFKNKTYPIGSVKSNIGHCESAAGVAALTKVLLQLQNNQLAPSLHAETLNPNVNWDASVFHVQRELSDWIASDNDFPRRAGVSSFGAGGSNVHLIIEEPPVNIQKRVNTKPHYLFTLSAKTQNSLHQKVQDLIRWIEIKEQDKHFDNAILENISYTLNAGRSHFEKRFAFVASSIAELKLSLQQFDEENVSFNAFVNLSIHNKARPEIVSKRLFQKIIEDMHTSQISNQEYRENLMALANFYADGYDLPFVNLYSDEMQQKISLPTYPFNKQRYWINGDNPPEAPVKIRESVDSVAAVVMQHVSRTLKLNAELIRPHIFFTDLGFDSVTLKELANDLEKYYAITLPPTLFFTYKNIREVSQYLQQTFANEISQPVSVVANKPDQTDAVAVIGMHGYFPHSENLTEFWEHLLAGDDLVNEVPANRWDWRSNYGDAKNDSRKSNSKWGGFLPAIDQFDAGFFSLSAREANLMDPQHRLFLEVVWKAIEDAGIDPLSLSGQKIGVFAGVEFNEYQAMIAQAKNDYHGYIATGTSHSLLTNRVSYFLNLMGPSEAIDTACSSSLVAIHRGVNAIRQGECKLSIVGGVSLMVNPDTFIVTSQLGALSPDGRCKTFDAGANGYVKGEGVAALVLKSLQEAERDGDPIYAVIKGSAVNHGGKAQSITAPNAVAQKDVLIAAYQNAGIDPATVSYVEAHGTGTELGDPIEVEALQNAFKALNPNQDQTAYCGLGSLKTNIGHLEPASGIAGVMKVLLSMRYEKIPATIHFKKLNPYIDFSNSPFYLVTQSQEWKRLRDANGNEIPRRAGVSSFGFGGTNAHIVFEEVKAEIHTQEMPFYLITLSAKQEVSLKQKLVDLLGWLDNKTVDLAALSYTLNTGRAHFERRVAMVVASVAELQTALRALINNQEAVNCVTNAVTSVGWVERSETQRFVRNGERNTLGFAALYPTYEDLLSLAHVYCQQKPINWSDIYNNEKINRLTLLPSYPFNHQSYWFDKELKSASVKTVIETVSTDLNDFALNYLRNLFAEKIQIPPTDLDYDTTYEVYGVDSVLGLEITQRLENDFGDLPKTLLYERNSLRNLAKYFCQKYNAKLEQLSGGIQSAAALTSTTQQINVATSTNHSEDIAIIGMSGTYPMANDMDELWENLKSGRDCVSEVPGERWNYKDYPVTVGGEEKFFNKGGFIPDIDKFDPLFFGIAPSDAALMDPQERLFMQSAWATLEDAGYTREALQRTVSNHVGVFVGVTYNFYPLFVAEEWTKGNRIPLDIQLFSIANRVSYFLNASGPSFIIDTACSSSLAAIHQACESIARGECTVAIAGGVNLSLHPSKYHMLGSMSFLSDNGKCTSFGEGGSGYVPGEGVGSILLKPLSLALRDNDRIYAVIKASSMNHGGKTSGYTVPNPMAQAEVIKSALAKSKINARTVSYIEAHGTGTSLGDPIEVSGLQQAFEDYTQDKQFCALGSVKSNLGHLESAAGISQISKVILQMQHKQIVPSLHSKTLNPFIDFANSAFYVPQGLADWNPQNVPRRAGVSSFGAGGVNVHVILEEYAENKVKQTSNSPYIFLLSAFNTERLQAYIQQMYAYIAKQASSDNFSAWLQDACYTSQIGREAMTARLAIVATSAQDMLAKLKSCTHDITQRQFNIWYNEKTKVKHKAENLTGLSLANDYEKLIQLWIDGSKISWQELHKQNKCYLPSYPFAKRRCWVGSQVVVKKALPTQQYIIFSDLELGFHSQNQLADQSFIYCFIGDEFQQFSENVFYLNPERLDDYTKLFEHISKQATEISLIYLWTLIPKVASAKINQRFIYLFQTLIQQKWQQKMQFCLVNRENNATESEVLQHHLWNLQEFLTSNNAANQLLLIDLAANANISAEVKTIFAELKNFSRAENHIYFKNGIRQACALKNPEQFIEEIVQRSAQIETSLDNEEVTTLVLNTLAQQLAMDVTEIDPEIPFLNYGMDSIIGINFVAELNKSFPDALSPMDLYRYPAVTELVNHILKLCAPKSSPAPQVTQLSLQTESEFFAEISHLNDAEVSKLLEEELLELDELLAD